MEPEMDPEWEVLLNRQREEFRAERNRHTREIERIDRELADLDAAERVLERLDKALPQDESPAYLAPPTTLVGRPVHVGSVRGLVLLILQGAYPRGLKSSAIREKGRSESSYDINPNTLTVTLGRLKSDGLVRIEGKTWFLVPKESSASLNDDKEKADEKGREPPPFPPTDDGG